MSGVACPIFSGAQHLLRFPVTQFDIGESSRAARQNYQTIRDEATLGDLFVPS
jgi:hypothetical protein